MAEHEEAPGRERVRHKGSPIDRLHQAMAVGNPKALAEALGDGADPEAQGPEGYVPIEFAVDRRDVEAVKLLLEAGADPNTSYVPLIFNAIGGSLDLIETLIAAGASLDAIYDGSTALWKAAHRGDLSTVDLLLKAGADPRAGASPALIAAEKRHREIARRLLPFEDNSQVISEVRTLLAEADRLDAYTSRHPDAIELFKAIETGDSDFVRRWLDSGLPANTLVIDRWEGPISPLRAASLNGEEDIARLLLESGAPIEGAKDDEGSLEGSTPLIDAIRSGSLGLAIELIDSGAQVDSIRDAGAEGKIPPVLHLLGPDIPMNPDGTIPTSQVIELIERLALAGADLDAADRFGATALIWAVQRGNPMLVAALLRLGSDPEIRDSDDNTARTHATYRLSSLGYQGSERSAPRSEGRPTQSDYRAILDMLGKCRPHRCLEAKLVAAAFHGDIRTVRISLERGAAVDHDLGSGTALDMALLRSHKPVVEALLGAGAKVAESQRLVIDRMISSG